jgi:regulator of protease activity HflC (stomatin/prohibitin superfamily)
MPAATLDDLAAEFDIIEPTEPAQPRFLTHKARLRVTIGALVLVFLLAYLWRMMFITVNAGQGGVLWRRFYGGVVISRTYGEGLHVIPPWDRIDIYDTRVQEKREDLSLLTKQGLAVSIVMTARFHPRFKDLPLLDQRFGPQYQQTVVWPEVVSALRRVVGEYTPEELYSLSEQQLVAAVQASAAKPVSDCMVDLDRVLLTRVKLPEAIQNSIQDKLSAQQKVETYTYLLAQTELEKKRRAVEGSGIRDFEKLSGISMLKWRAIETQDRLANSPNSKIVVFGNACGTPLVVNSDK